LAAVKLTVDVAMTLGAVGAMAIETTTGAVTVKAAALDVIPFNAAVMELVPMPAPVAIPLVFSVAAAVLLECQVTVPEMLPLLPSEYMPVAVKVALLPLAMDALPGVTAIPVKVAAVTVMPAAGDVTPLNVAVTDVVPTVVPDTTPGWVPMLAIAGSADVQTTCDVMSAVEASEYVPVAVRLLVRPLAIMADTGVIAILFNVTAGAVTDAPVPLFPPQAVSSETIRSKTPDLNVLEQNMTAPQ